MIKKEKIINDLRNLSFKDWLVDLAATKTWYEISFKKIDIVIFILAGGESLGSFSKTSSGSITLTSKFVEYSNPVNFTVDSKISDFKELSIVFKNTDGQFIKPQNNKVLNLPELKTVTSLPAKISVDDLYHIIWKLLRKNKIPVFGD